jgi:hypothetical protein
MRLWVIVATDVLPGATPPFAPSAPVLIGENLPGAIIGEVEDVKRIGTDLLALVRIDNEAAILPSGKALTMTDAVSVGLRPESLRPKDPDY